MPRLIIYVSLVHLFSQTLSEITFHRAQSEREDNSIHSSNAIHENNLGGSTETLILELKQLIQHQTDLILNVVSGQEQVIRENTKWLKRYRSTRRYLRKLHRSCLCKNPKRRENDFSSNESEFSKLWNENKQRSFHTPTFNDLDFVLPNTFQERRSLLSSRKKHLKEKHDDDVTFNPKRETVTMETSETKFDILPEGGEDKFEIARHFEDDPLLETLPNTLGATSTVDISLETYTSRIKGFREDKTGSVDLVSNNVPGDEWQTFISDSTGARTLSPEGTTEKTDVYDFEVDLTTGKQSGDNANISWISDLQFGETVNCGLQGVVKISFPHVEEGEIQHTIMIDMWFDKPVAWVFNIGDSRSNDGMSGDGSSQENDCEADGYGSTFTVHGSDKAVRPLDKLLHVEGHYIRNNASFLITDESISWKTESGNYETLRDPSLFALKGQQDSQGSVDYEIYVGMNRVIAGNYRRGSGLCKVGFKWLMST